MRFSSPASYLLSSAAVLLLSSSTITTTEAFRLNSPNLGQVSDKVKQFDYVRSKITPGIVHVGTGHFYRAWLAPYIDDTLKEDPSFGIIGAGIRPGMNKYHGIMQDQDSLFTIIERDASTVNPYIVGAQLNTLPYDENHGPLYEQLCQPDIKIVSTTVTEGGYFMNDGKFDASNELIQADVKDALKSPKTLFGVIVKALKYRKENGLNPFTVMCCDNICGNGEITRDVVVGLAKLIDPDLAEWIGDKVSFPNSMVRSQWCVLVCLMI